MAFRSAIILLIIMIVLTVDVFCYATYKLRPRSQRFASFNNLLNTIPVMPKLTFYPQAPTGRPN